MSVNLYDDALKAKFTDIFDNFVISEPDRAFQRSAEENGGKVRLPLLSLNRENYTLNREYYNSHMVRRGRMTNYTSNDKSTVNMVKGLPIRINYQLDVWAQKREQVDKLTKELLFWMTYNSNVNVVIPNTDGATRDFEFVIEDLVDNSDIISFEERGRFYRMTIQFIFENAELFNTEELKTALTYEFELIAVDEL